MRNLAIGKSSTAQSALQPQEAGEGVNETPVKTVIPLLSMLLASAQELQ